MLKKTLTFIIMLVVISCAFTALAAHTEPTVYVPIEGSNFVVDELHGVPAYYNRYDRQWQCVEYMRRYYLEVFGVKMSVDYNSAYIIEGEGEFEKAETPRTGDVVYWPSYLRAVNYGHVAIVKSYADGVITLIEQNWRYNGKAAVERQITWPSNGYYVFTLTGEEADRTRGELLGIWDMSVVNEDYALVSNWAVSEIDQAISQGLVDPIMVEDYSKPITRLAFCNMNAELLSRVSPDIGDIPLLDGAGAAKEECEECKDSPDEEMTRQQAAMMIARSVDLTGLLSEEFDPVAVLSIYEDAALIDPDAVWAMAALVELGVYKGTGDGKLAPGEIATVEQAVSWLVRTCALYEEKTK